MRYSWLIAIKKSQREKEQYCRVRRKRTILSSQKKKNGWLRVLSISIVSTFSTYQLKIIFVTNDRLIIIKETVTTWKLLLL